jgi:hypothetical protein
MKQKINGGKIKRYAEGRKEDWKGVLQAAIWSILEHLSRSGLFGFL